MAAASGQVSLGQAADGPDLMITAVNCPDQLVINEELHVSGAGLEWTVTNLGANEAAASWADLVCLGPDPVLDLSQVSYSGPVYKLADWPYWGESWHRLAEGQSYTAGGWDLWGKVRPFVPPGGYYLFIVADYGGRLAEADETNNVWTKPVEIVPGTADLQVTSVTAPASAQPGQQIRVTWTVTNAGQGRTGTWWEDRVYVSNADVFDRASAEPLASVRHDAPSVGAGSADYWFDPGEAYSADAVLTLPRSLLPGSRYVFVETDAPDDYDMVSELDESNNVGSAQIAITVDADLQCTAVTAPQRAQPGEQVNVQWTVTNAGSGPTGASKWSDSYYLSSSVTFDPTSATYIGQTSHSGQLNAGATYSTSNSHVTVPKATAPGSYYLVVATDCSLYAGDHDRVAETDETNNAASTPLEIGIYADLRVTSLTAPARAQPNESIAIQWTIDNAGSGPTAIGGWYDYVYLSPSPTYDAATATYLTHRASSGKLAAGASYSVSRSCTIPRDQAPGSYYVLVRADYYDSVVETDETNNVASTPLEVGVDADLRVTSLTAPARAQPNESITIQWTIGNAGSGPTAIGEWCDYVYLSPSPTYDAAAATYLTQRSRSGKLAAGASYSASVSCTIPLGQAAGSYYVLVRADRDDSVAETDETNNVGIRPIRIGWYADLRVTAVTAPRRVSRSQAVPVGWTVTNEGTVSAGPTTWRDSVYLSTSPTLDPASAQALATAPHATTLEPEASYSGSLACTIPASQTPGSYYLFVVTDAADTVPEADETNNAAASPLEVGTSADLQVTALTAPALTQLNQPFAVQCTVSNGGTEATGASSWADRVYLGTSPAFDPASAMQLASRTRSGQLAAGASYPASFTCTIARSQAPGAYYLHVVTDATDVVIESDEANNNAQQPLDVGASNLVPTSLVCPDQTTPQDGIEIRFTVGNAGDASTVVGSWTDYLYISGDATLNLETAEQLGTVKRTGALDAGDSYTTSKVVAIPRDLEQGTCYLFLYADKGDAVAESREDDNALGVPIEVGPPQADLVVSSVTCPDVLRPTEQFEVNWEVANQGAATTPGGVWRDHVYLSHDDVLDTTDDVPLGSFSHTGALEPGASYTTRAAVRLPRDTTPGPIWIIVFTDAEDAVAESDETNNTAWAPSLCSTSSTGANLVVPGVRVPDNALLGETIEIAWRTRNIGTESTLADSWVDRVYLSPSSSWDSDAAVLMGETKRAGVLGASREYQSALTADVPKTLTSGTYYLHVLADAIDDVAESVEEDNVGCSAPVIVGTCDLTVSDLEAPTELWSGQSYDVRWTTLNAGPVAARPMRHYVFGPTLGGRYITWRARVWSDCAWLSRTPTPEGTKLGQFDFGSELGAGETYQHTHRITVPKEAEGDYYLVVAADAVVNVFLGHWDFDNHFMDTDAVTESDENNNSDVLAIPVHVSPYPDLQVREVTAPAEAFAGQEVGIRFRISNEGNGIAEPADWTERLFLSLTDVLDSLTSTPLRDLLSPVILEPGESYETTVPVELARDRWGDRYFHVRTDANNSVFEGPMEDNNLGVSNVTHVELPPLPDLVVTNVTCPPTGWSGQPLSVRWTVQNVGVAATATGEWTDSIFISDQDAFSEDAATWLGDSTHTGALAANDSYTTETEARLPVGISGTYYVYVVTDSEQVSGELNVLNNTGRSGQIVVTMSPPPDLVVEALTAPSPAVIGAPLEVKWTVANRGPGATVNGSWSDDAYLSQSDELDSAEAVLLGSAAHSGDLQPDGTYAATATWTVPKYLTAGAWFLHLFTDGSDAEFEWDYEDNNVRTIPVELVPPGADLQVSSVTAPPGAYAGDSVNLAWEVTNAGTGDTVKDKWQDVVYLSKEDPLAEDAIAVGVVTRSGALAAGEPYNVSAAAKLPAELSGVYYVFVWTDGTDEVLESNDGNNTGRAVGTLSVQLAHRPDLVVSSGAAPTTATAGTPITVTWTTTNTGADGTRETAWYDSVYVSAQEALEIDHATRLGVLAHSGVLAQGASYQQQRSATIPSQLSGTYYIHVLTDSAGQVAEASDENNGWHQAIEIDADPTFGKPKPDLQVDTFDVPALAYAGQTVTVVWGGSNQGEGAAEGKWYDGVYLSRDEALNDASKPVTHRLQQGPLAPGESYPGSAEFDLPADIEGTYYVHVKADAFGNVSEVDEGNNLLGPKQIEVRLPELTDLAVEGVTAPATAMLGSSIQVGWTVRNVSARPAEGRWSDGVYLSKDQTWSADDPNVGYAQHDGDVPAGESYSGILTAEVPGVLPGPYYVIVRCDVKQQARDKDRRNNVAAAAEPTVVDAQELTLGVPHNSTLQTGANHYYKVAVPEAQDLAVSLDCSKDDAVTELFVSYNEVPSRASYGYAPDNPFEADHEVAVPNTQEGWYYILVRGESIPGDSTDYTILARLLEFEVHSISPESGGNTGQTTADIRGAQFRGEMAARLTQGDTVVKADPVSVESSAQIYARFDLRGVHPGQYDVQVQRLSDGEVRTLKEAFTVVQGQGGRFVARLEVPSRVLVGRSFLGWVTYGNVGDADLPAPLLLLRAPEEIPMRLSAEYEADYGELQILALGEGGDVGVLRTGVWQQVPVYIEMTRPGNAHFALLSQAANEEPLPWKQIEAAVHAAHPEGDWQGLCKALREFVGGSWHTYLCRLSSEAGGLHEMRSVSSLWACVLIHALSARSGFQELTCATSGGPPATAGAGPEGGDEIDITNVTYEQFGAWVESRLAFVPSWFWEWFVSLLQGFLPEPQIPIALANPCFARVALAVFNRNTEAYERCERLGLDNPWQDLPRWRNGKPKRARADSTPTCVLPPRPSRPGGEDEADTAGIYPIDPNLKLGPAGTGPDGLVSPGVPLPYTVLFENLPEATAPASEVRITDQLDANLDWRSFRLGQITFGSTVVAVPPDRAFWTGRVHHGDLDVDVDAGLDITTGQVHWYLRAIDPDTGEPPTEAGRGFLPPNDDAGSGQGALGFTIKAKAGLPSGSEVRNEASIVFDYNEPIVTNEVVNAVAPSAGVLPATTKLSYTGDTSVDALSTLHLKALLTTDDGAPIAGKTVQFVWNGGNVFATTDADGVASHDYTGAKAAGDYALTIGFAGDDECVASRAYASFTVTSAATSVDGQGKISYGSTSRNQATFVITARKNDPPTGSFTINDLGRRKSIVSTAIATVTIDTTATPARATITGTCNVNGAASDFTLTVTDGAPDTLSFTAGGYTLAGNAVAGDITIQ